jgi:hypothetical protein
MGVPGPMRVRKSFSEWVTREIIWAPSEKVERVWNLRAGETSYFRERT